MVSDAFFLLIEGILFFIVYIAEYTRAKAIERERKKEILDFESFFVVGMIVRIHAR
jgi:hypothetical protein